MSRGGLRSNLSAPEIYPLGRSVHFDWENPNPIMADPNAMATNALNIVPEGLTDNPLSADFNRALELKAQFSLEKSKGPVDGQRIGDTVADAKKLHEFLNMKATTFGPCCTHIPITFDATGSPTMCASLIEQYQSMTLQHVIRVAHKYFGADFALCTAIPNSSPTSLWPLRAIDPANDDADKAVFYNRVQSAVMAQCLCKIMNPTALTNLELKKAPLHVPGCPRQPQTRWPHNAASVAPQG